MADLVILGFAALLLIAAGHDVATMKIPNWISIALVVTFPLAALAGGFAWPQLGAHVAFGVAAFVVVLIMFQLNLMGGGDAKLIAASSVWLGLAAAPAFIVWTTLAGGVLALVALAARRAFAPSADGPAFLNRLLSRERGIPYGVAICVGALAALPVSTWGAL